MNHKNHNPEWCSQKKNNQCDCIVEVDDVDMTPGGIMTKYVIRYCPTHEQAAALQAENAVLLETLITVKLAILAEGKDSGGIIRALIDPAICKAKAKGK